MQEFEVCNKDEHQVHVLCNGIRYPIDLSLIKNTDGGPVTYDSICIGDTLSQDSLGTISLLPPRLEPIYAVSSYLTGQYPAPAWFAKVFPTIRPIKQGDRNQPIALGLKIVENCYLYKNRQLLQRLSQNRDPFVSAFVDYLTNNLEIGKF